MSTVQLLQGDCLDLMKSLPDGSVDAVVTDPPYGIDYNPNGGGQGAARRGSYAKVIGDNLPFDPAQFVSFPIVCLWGANHYASRLPDSPTWLVWYKREELPTRSFADCEMAWCNKRGPARVFSHRWDGMIKDSERGIPRVHPTQKPIALMEWVLDTLKIPKGATVLDPFMGSGTTGVACVRTGRNFIGFELDEHYFTTAQTRINDEIAKQAEALPL